MTIDALAEKFGVHKNTVIQATDDEARARAHAYHREWQRGGKCADCDAQVTRRSSGHKPYRCVDCATRLRATTVREDSLQCKTCREWKADQDFPRNRGGRKLRRGRHESCRVCCTILRQEYRERHKIPCVSCGKPRLPANEKGSGIGRRDTGLCLDCYRTSIRKAAA